MKPANPQIQATKNARSPRRRDVLRRTTEALSDDRNRDAKVWADGIVRRVLVAQGRTEATSAEWAALYRRLFGPVTWPTMRALRDAWLARAVRFNSSDMLKQRAADADERDLPRRARVVVLLGWTWPGMTRAQLTTLSRDHNCGIRTANPFHGWRARLERNDRKLRELQARIRAEGVEIDWTDHSARLHSLSDSSAKAA